LKQELQSKVGVGINEKRQYVQEVKLIKYETQRKRRKEEEEYLENIQYQYHLDRKEKQIQIKKQEE